MLIKSKLLGSALEHKLSPLIYWFVLFNIYYVISDDSDHLKNEGKPHLGP